MSKVGVTLTEQQRNYLKQLREQRNLNCSSVSRYLGKHICYMSKIETGVFNPSEEVLQKLLDLYNVSDLYPVVDSNVQIKKQKIKSVCMPKPLRKDIKKQVKTNKINFLLQTIKENVENILKLLN